MLGLSQIYKVTMLESVIAGLKGTWHEEKENKYVRKKLGDKKRNEMIEDYENFESNILDFPESQEISNEKLYSIDICPRISISQFINLSISSTVFSVSIFLLISSIFWETLGHVTPWFFWSIPVIGSLGIWFGIMLNIFVDYKE